jgi:hypothetical protein
MKPHCLLFLLLAVAAKPILLALTMDGVNMSLYGDAIMAIGVLRALGVSDATTASTDIISALQLRPLEMRLTEAAKTLDVPPRRFFAPEIAKFLSF